MNIWGRYQGRPPEKIDSDLPKNDALRCLYEYRLAFGKDWILWLGRKKDDPTIRSKDG